MAKKAHFTPALFTFLSELRLHNDRDWFERNRERYLRDVRDPMLRFIADFAPVLRRIAPRLVADPRPNGGSLFRLYRDTRFSSDKTPYKTNVAAHFRHEAGRDVHGPAYYLSLDPDEVIVGGGIWHPEPEALKLIRRTLEAEPAKWKRALLSPSMKRLEFWGDSLKRAPRGVPDDHPLKDMLRRKDFAAGLELKEDDALSPRFMESCAEVFRALVPVMKLLARAVDLSW
ncbi:MAG TPA: DUF2461 domain-containing protein [Anaeromyxobacteraceae bacterium]|nr:DUF2461 domain-containing protein [Anaeromyxobacteraceae bacterium]